MASDSVRLNAAVSTRRVTAQAAVLRERRYGDGHPELTARALAGARAFPVYRAWVNDDWPDTGLALVVVCRRQPNGRLAAGVFLLDLWCRGLIETFAMIDLDVEGVEDDLLGLLEPRGLLETVTLAEAARLVRTGLRRGHELGFAPPAGFLTTVALLDRPGDPEESARPAECAPNDPLYVVSPFDQPLGVIETLMAAPIDRFEVYDPPSGRLVRYERIGASEHFDRELVAV